MRVLFLFIVLVVFTGCASSKMSVNSPLEISSENQHSIHTIAMAPGGGLFSDAIAVELSNRGFQVYDSAQTSNFMARLNLNELEISKPQNLHFLVEEGIDALLSVKAASGLDGLPQSASVRLNSTHNNKVLAGITWQNGWGGMHGSICDRQMRKDVSTASAEITDGLVKVIEKRRLK